jgi:signal transduction histidine kinase
MELNAAQSDSERFELARLLERHRNEIETRWLKRVATELNRHGVSEAELRNSIPDYLVALSEALSRTDESSMQDRGGSSWVRIAREHAVTRAKLGFDVDEVVREFFILRRIIFEVLEEQLPRSSLSQVDRLSSLIEGALRAAVKTYVDHRDWETRREQARHIGFLTHELRNPLATIMLSSGKLRKLASPGLERVLDPLERSARRLTNLVDQTLLAQRLEVGEVQSHPRQLALGELLDPILKTATERAGVKGVQIESSYDPGTMLEVDASLATSAVQNVVDNAAKFTDHGRVLVRVDDASDEVVFHVFDECEGLSPEELATIFEPFKRGHSQKPGSGLGLAIARRAVEAHGKTIHAESTSGHGCHFWFALPKASH